MSNLVAKRFSFVCYVFRKQIQCYWCYVIKNEDFFTDFTSWTLHYWYIWDSSMWAYIFYFIFVIKCIEVFIFGSLCEVIEEGLDSVSSDDNISDPIMESLSNNFLNSSLLNNSIEITSTGNDSITNDTTISNATLIKKFTCLLDDTPAEGNSTFQVCDFLRNVSFHLNCNEMFR